jgi:hypothetical protein
MVRYNIFNGWQKLPIKINPSISQTSFDIYADCISGYEDLPSIFANMGDTMTPVQLYVYANMTDSERKFYADVGQRITVDTGYMGPEGAENDAALGGQLLIGNGSTYVMTLENNRTATYPYSAQFKDEVNDRPFATTIQPLKADNDEFTLAIDYAFDPAGVANQRDSYPDTEMVLVSCYSKDSSNAVAGFKLFHYYDS